MKVRVTAVMESDPLKPLNVYVNVGKFCPEALVLLSAFIVSGFAVTVKVSLI